MVQGHRVPNLRPVGPSQLYYILLADFMDSYIEVSVMKKGTSVSIMTRWDIYRGIIPWERFLQGKMKF